MAGGCSRGPRARVARVRHALIPVRILSYLAYSRTPARRACMCPARLTALSDSWAAAPPRVRNGVVLACWSAGQAGSGCTVHAMENLECSNQWYLDRIMQNWCYLVTLVEGTVRLEYNFLTRCRYLSTDYCTSAEYSTEVEVQNFVGNRKFRTLLRTTRLARRTSNADTGT